jgi:hypothetical protein
MSPTPELMNELKKTWEEVKRLDPQNKFITTIEHNLNQKVRDTDHLQAEIQTGYTNVNPLSPALALAAIGQRKFIVDVSGQYKTEAKFDQMMHLVNSVFMVRVNDKWGIWNPLNKQPVNAIYDKVEKENEYVRVHLNSKIGLVNPTGVLIVPSTYQAVKMYDGFISVKGDYGWGAFSEEGKVIVKPNYQTEIVEGRYQVRKVLIAEKSGKKYYFTFEGECLNCKGRGDGWEN